MEGYFFFHLHFKQQLRIYQPIQRAQTLFIVLRCPLTQAQVVYEHACIYYAVHPVALFTEQMHRCTQL